MSAPNPTELRATLIALIAGATETSATRWEALVDDIEVLPIVFNPRCNWRVAVTGPPEDRAVIDKAIELLRDAEPYVTTMEGPGG